MLSIAVKLVMNVGINVNETGTLGVMEYFCGAEFTALQDSKYKKNTETVLTALATLA